MRFGHFQSRWGATALTATALLASLLLVACLPLPTPPPPAPLTLCDAKLETVPKVFEVPLRAMLEGPQLDGVQLARAECIDATATRHLREVAAREAAAGRKVADYAVAGFFARRSARVEAQAANAAVERAWLDLADARDELSRTINALYAAPVKSSQRGIDLLPLTALVLFDYARLTREHLGKPVHTLVRRLTDQPFCAGDLVMDRLLWRYFEAALRVQRDGTAAEAEAALALRQIAIQTSCLGERQLFEFDAALSDAARELTGRLDAANLGAVGDAAAPFILQVRLLILDADKHLGGDSPGLLWFLQQDSLRRQMRTQALRPLEQVLWLYDRRSAALAALKTHCTSGTLGTACINLSVFLDSLTRPVAFGFGECSMLEMVEGGVRSIGGVPAYTCTPGVCGTPTSEGRMPMTGLAQSFNTAFGRGSGYQLPTLPGTTPFGVELPDARKNLCGNAGGFGGRNGGAGDGGPGMGPGGDKLACVLGERAARTAALIPGMACISRFVAATSPLAPPNESMQATAYAGIPRGCEIGDPAGGDGGTSGNTADGMNPMDPMGADAGTADGKKTAADLQKQAKDLAAEIKKDPAKMADLKKAIKDASGVDVTDKQITDALNRLANGEVTTSPIIIDGKIANAATDADGNITFYLGKMNDRSDADNRQTMLHELVHSVMNVANEQRHANLILIKSLEDTPSSRKTAQEYRDKIEKDDEQIRKHWKLTNGSNKRCVQDDVNCNNSCNGMSKQTQQALACLADALNPQTVPPRPADLVTDPIEPTSSSGQFTKCFDDGLDIGGVVAARQCSAVRCANDQLGMKSGQCCQTGGALNSGGLGAQQREICTQVRCEASVGMAGAATGGDLGLCGCGGGAGLPPGTPPPMPPNEGPFPPRP